MIRIKNYWVFRDIKSEPHRLDAVVDDIESKRKELEEKHGCIRKTILGESERIGYIFFEYKNDKK